MKKPDSAHTVVAGSIFTWRERKKKKIRQTNNN